MRIAVTKCPKCADIDELSIEIDYLSHDCRKCGARVKLSYFENSFKPGESSFDAASRRERGCGKKETSSVPINIWTPLPNGGMNLTRIGKKSDIDNSMP